MIVQLFLLAFVVGSFAHLAIEADQYNEFQAYAERWMKQVTKREVGAPRTQYSGSVGILAARDYRRRLGATAAKDQAMSIASTGVREFAEQGLEMLLTPHFLDVEINTDNWRFDEMIDNVATTVAALLQEKRIAAHAFYVLFTDLADPDPTRFIVGQAFVAAMCQTNAVMYVSMRGNTRSPSTPASAALTFTHELGHSAGALHTSVACSAPKSSCPNASQRIANCPLMSPSLCRCCNNWEWKPDTFSQILELRNARTTARNGCLAVTVADVTTVDRAIVESIIRLYIAYFKRDPDESGLSYWVKRHVDAGLGGTLTIHGISQFFATSPEFKTRYGDTTNAEFVALVYRNVLDREGEPGGVAYWLNQLNTNAITRGQCMTAFSDSPENKMLQKERVATIASPRASKSSPQYSPAGNNAKSHEIPMALPESTTDGKSLTTAANEDTTAVDSSEGSNPDTTDNNNQSPSLDPAPGLTTVSNNQESTTVPLYIAPFTDDSSAFTPFLSSLALVAIVCLAL